jgi:hypothetical protein
LRQAASRPRFGALEGIRGSEFVQKVTQASEEAWVVVLLYKESHEGCALLLSCFEELAAKYPSSKYVKIISTDCIPNYPDQNLPTVLVYSGGACKHNLVGLATWGGSRTTPEQVGCGLPGLLLVPAPGARAPSALGSPAAGCAAVAAAASARAWLQLACEHCAPPATQRAVASGQRSLQRCSPGLWHRAVATLRPLPCPRPGRPLAPPVLLRPRPPAAAPCRWRCT